MKKLIALILAAALCLTLLAACGSSETAAEEDTAAAEETAAEETTEEPAEEEPAAEEETEEASAEEESDAGEEQEIATVKWAFYDIYGASDFSEKVIDAINEITEAEIGVHIEPTYMDFGTYMSQIPLMLQSGEQLDIITLTPMPGCSYTDMYAAGQLLDISEYLNSDITAGLRAELGDYIDCFNYNGGMYGIPALRCVASSDYIIMREDVLDELGLTETAESMTTWAEYKALLEQVMANTDAVTCGVTNGSGGGYALEVNVQWNDFENGSFSDYEIWDNLGDATKTLWTDQDGNVGYALETDAFVQTMEYWAEMYNEGLAYQDGPVTQETSSDLMKENVAFSAIMGGEPNMISDKEASLGLDLTGIKLNEGLVKTYDLTSWGLALAYTSEEPEAAMKFINMLYTDERLMNLVCYGIEGDDYTLDADGIANYPNGDGTGLYHAADFVFGNQFLLHPWSGVAADYRETSKAANEEMATSAYMGFVLDTSEMTNTIAALDSVTTEYYYGMIAGLYTPELYDEFMAKMEDAGVRDYISAVQTQLDAWLAAQ